MVFGGLDQKRNSSTGVGEQKDIDTVLAEAKKASSQGPSPRKKNLKRQRKVIYVECIWNYFTKLVVGHSIWIWWGSKKSKEEFSRFSS